MQLSADWPPRLLLLIVLRAINGVGRQQQQSNVHPQRRNFVDYPASPSASSRTPSRLSCYSCMSAYFENQYQYVSKLYRLPAGFKAECDPLSLNVRRLDVRNCSDMCITLRIYDRIGGIRRFGHYRGCMSDIIEYNVTAIQSFSAYHDRCVHISLRELFTRRSSKLVEFDPADQVHLCACHSNYCNGTMSIVQVNMTLLMMMIIAISMHNYIEILH